MSPLAGRRAPGAAGTKGTGAAIVEALRRDGASVVTTARHGEPSELFVRADTSTVAGTQAVIEAVKALAAAVVFGPDHYTAFLAELRAGFPQLRRV